MRAAEVLRDGWTFPPKGDFASYYGPLGLHVHALKRAHLETERGYPVCAAATVTSQHTTDGSVGRRRRKEGELRLQRGRRKKYEG